MILIWQTLRNRRFYLFLCVVIIVLLISYYILNITNIYLLELEKCPACYGESLCNHFQNGNITLPFKQHLLQFLNVKNVYFGWWNNHKVILKKLGHSNELEVLDKSTCYNDGIISPCHLSMAVQSNQLKVDQMKKKTFITSCLSSKLLNLFENCFQEYQDRPWKDKISAFLTILGINPEPIVLQAFPASQGWPFPAYLGACGRLIVVESGGWPLQYYYNTPWQIRLDLAYQLFHLAVILTNHSQEYSIYMTDVSYENFAVNFEGKLLLIDLEHLIIVDKELVQKEKPEGWDNFYVNSYNDCIGLSECLEFNPDHLCDHLYSDHNIYAVCHSILSSSASYPAMPGGILHDLPPEILAKSELEYLLKECDTPMNKYGRFEVAPKLLETLRQFRDLFTIF